MQQTAKFTAQYVYIWAIKLTSAKCMGRYATRVIYKIRISLSLICQTWKKTKWNLNRILDPEERSG